MIDAHVHLWDLRVRDQSWIPAGSPIRRTFTVADLRSTLASTPVEQVVLVQVINDAEETHAFLRLARDEDIVAGVVGWADLASPQFPEVIAALTGTGRLVGVRHQALAEADPAGWLCLPAVQRGLADLEHAGLPFDLIIRPEHFPAAVALARAHSSLQLVLNHLGKPPIRSGELEPWATGLRQLADLPNLSCKLSGVQTIAAPGWMYPDLAPFLDLVLTSFGPDRILFGSDWPVCTRAASYVEVVEVARKACVNLTPAEQAAVFGENARRIYRMPRRPLP